MDRQETLTLLRQFGIQPTRSLGQNFLIDDRITGRICQCAELNSADLVIEIGPGIGNLTRELAARAGRVIAIEIDRHVLPALEASLMACQNCTVIHADALTVDLALLVGDWPGPIKVVANLPYYITTPLIVKILCELSHCEQLVLMIQKEAAGRILTSPNSKQYGPLAILTACFGDASREMIVPAASFFPVPGVDSCIIRIKENHKLQINDWQAFHRFLESCFAQRRKTLLNCLKAAGYKPERLNRLPDLLTEMKLAVNARAEMLSCSQFLTIYHYFFC